MKPKRKKTTQDGSVSLGTFDGADLRLTPSNNLFVTYKGETVWPYIRGMTVCFDDPTFRIPPKAFAKVREVLMKKQNIRKEHALDFDDELLEISTTFSNE